MQFWCMEFGLRLWQDRYVEEILAIAIKKVDKIRISYWLDAKPLVAQGHLFRYLGTCTKADYSKTPTDWIELPRQISYML